MKRRNESEGVKGWVKKKVLKGVSKVAGVCIDVESRPFLSQSEGFSTQDGAGSSGSSVQGRYAGTQGSISHNVVLNSLPTGTSENTENIEINMSSTVVDKTGPSSQSKHDYSKLLFQGFEKKHFLYLTMIDEGAYGKIYDALVNVRYRKELETFPEKVAIKVVTVDGDNERNQVRKEVAIHKLINDCTEIVTLFGHFQDEHTENIVMEYLDGENLLTNISNHGLYFEEQAMKIMKDIFSALLAMHEQGLAHLDLNPRNVVFKEKWYRDDHLPPSACLIDFGASMKCDEKLTETVGTAGYVPPEMFSRFLSHPSCSMDIWSAGAIFYELLCGCEPYVCISIENQLSVMSETQLSIENMKTLPGVTEETKRMVLSCLDKDPKSRPSAKKMSQYLEHRLSNLEVEKQRYTGQTSASQFQ